jgi:hypothetical protein
LLRSFENSTQRKLHHNGTECSPEHDQGSSRLQELADAATLQHQSTDDTSDRNYNSTNAALIHVQLLKNALLRV